MADWKEMYLTMFRASEKAMRILEAAQLECEEMYMRNGDEEAERARQHGGRLRIGGTRRRGRMRSGRMRRRGTLLRSQARISAALRRDG